MINYFKEVSANKLKLLPITDIDIGQNDVQK